MFSRSLPSAISSAAACNRWKTSEAVLSTSTSAKLPAAIPSDKNQATMELAERCLLRWRRLARVVEGDIMQTAQLEPELDKALDLLVERGPPVDRSAVVIATKELLGIALKEVVAHLRQEVVPGWEVAIKVPLGGSGLCSDVFHAAVGGTTNSKDSHGCLE